MLKAFADFVRQDPLIFEHQDFAPIVVMFRQLSRDSTAAGIRLCDMAAVIASDSSPYSERLYHLDRLVKDLKELGSPEVVLEKRVDYKRPH